MSKKIGIGVIGTGFWGRNHARVFSELESTRLVAVCDVDEGRAKAIAERYGADYYTRDVDLLARKDVEGVTICTPTTTHSEIAQKAIRYGKHLLVEKPMADTTAQAARIVEKAEENGLILQVGFIERFNPGVTKVKEIVDKGGIGDVILAISRRIGSWPERIGDVGVVKDSAIHDLDIMRFLFGEEPQTVYARAGSLNHRFEDYAQVVLSFSGIKTGFVEANWLTPHKLRVLTVTGSKAIVSADYITQEIMIEDNEKEVKPKTVYAEPLKLELQSFAESIISKRKPRVTGLDGLRALQIAEATLKSAETGKTIKLGF